MIPAHCPRCRRGMERGFLLDREHGGYRAGEWVEGAPQRSFWTGVKTRGKERIPITAYRCEACGYLEFYATEEGHEG